MIITSISILIKNILIICCPFSALLLLVQLSHPHYDKHFVCISLPPTPQTTSTLERKGTFFCVSRTQQQNWPSLFHALFQEPKEKILQSSRHS